MASNTRIVIGALVVAVIGLGVVLGLVMAMDDDMSNSSMMGAGSGYAGMMQAMGGMNSDAMLARMREVLGEDGYARMQEHMQQHQSGQGMMGDPSLDGMMHQMMDGMMSQMGLTGSISPTTTATGTP